jgi:protein-disulfide isomerase
METEKPIKRRSKKKVFTLIIVAVFIFGFVGGYAVGNKNSSTTGGAVTTPELSETFSVPNGADDDGYVGNENAPITIIEFSDYQCPYCRYFYTETYSKIIENYVDTGKVKIVYRDFPLGFHKAAIPYAMAAECAQDQGYWKEMHDTIYDEQNKVAQGTVEYVGDNIVRKWAKDLGMDMTEFNDCFDNEVHLEEIKADQKDALDAGVKGTPAFFIGNDADGYILLSGAQAFEKFQAAIEHEEKSVLGKFLDRFF